MSAITVPLTVEKVLFRLALLNSGVVPIARVFIELPLSLEEIEEYSDQVADGRSILKNQWGEFLTYEFPELMRQQVKPKLDDCPACGEDLPPAPTEGGVEVRRPLLCDACYRSLKRLNAASPDETVMDRLKGFFRGEEEEDPLQVMQTEHEIFFLGLRLGIEQFTYTTLAAQSRLPSTQLKERLDRMAGRRYINVGLLPEGDAVGYRFPPDLDYPKVHYKRLKPEQHSGRVDVTLDLPPEPELPPEPPKPAPLIRTRPVKKKLNIRIKGRRTRGE